MAASDIGGGGWGRRGARRTCAQLGFRPQGEYVFHVIRGNMIFMPFYKMYYKYKTQKPKLNIMNNMFCQSIMDCLVQV